ncbi:hypothetical protein BDZ97DRAFT_531706 [Flammula alnicola]|nr:hypothetical protein BDZ97DRAFT_531706 [Flammula alnicola]
MAIVLISKRRIDMQIYETNNIHYCRALKRAEAGRKGHGRGGTTNREELSVVAAHGARCCLVLVALSVFLCR